MLKHNIKIIIVKKLYPSQVTCELYRDTLYLYYLIRSVGFEKVSDILINGTKDKPKILSTHLPFERFLVPTPKLPCVIC